MGRASPYEGNQVDCAGGHLAAGDVDGSYSGHGAGHGRETVRGGSHGDSNMQELPVPEPMHGVQSDDSVPVIQKNGPQRRQPRRGPITK